MKTLYSALSVFVGISLWMNIGMGLVDAYPIHSRDLEPSFDYAISYQNDYVFYSTIFNQKRCNTGNNVTDLGDNYYSCAGGKWIFPSIYQVDSHDTFDKRPTINIENMQTARITSATAIPEPATMLFIATGLITFAGFIRNHRKP